jgi:hypothetical protein
LPDDIVALLREVLLLVELGVEFIPNVSIAIIVNLTFKS